MRAISGFKLIQSLGIVSANQHIKRQTSHIFLIFFF